MKTIAANAALTRKLLLEIIVGVYS
jgi:hypothetical protein